MAGIVVQNIERADAAVIDGLAALRRRDGARGAGPHRPARQPHAADLSRRAHRRVGGHHLRAPRATTGWSMSRSSSCRHGDILVLAPTSPCDDGYFGDLLATSAMARGCRGLVIDAGVRDVRDLTADGLPGLVEGGLRARHGQGDAGIGQRADRLRGRGDRAGRRDRRRRRRRLRGASARDAAAVLEKAQAREAAEEAQARSGSPRASSASTSTTCAASSRRWASNMSDGVRCMWMRGGTSKGGYFLADDLPADTAARDAFLLRVMGSPDPRQIDGMGGADPLTSKVAVVGKSARDGRRCRLSVPAGVRRSGRSSPTRRIAATSSPASARSRSSAGWSRRGTARPRVAHLHGEYRPGRGRDRADAGRPGHL